MISMRVVFTNKFSHPNAKGSLFRKGDLAFARQRSTVLEVRDARRPDVWHEVDPQLVERIQLDSPFDFMASPGHADLR